MSVYEKAPGVKPLFHVSVVSLGSFTKFFDAYFGSSAFRDSQEVLIFIPSEQRHQKISDIVNKQFEAAIQLESSGNVPIGRKHTSTSLLVNAN
jgi:hypothetical protein